MVAAGLRAKMLIEFMFLVVSGFDGAGAAVVVVWTCCQQVVNIGIVLLLNIDLKIAGFSFLPHTFTHLF